MKINFSSPHIFFSTEISWGCMEKLKHQSASRQFFPHLCYFISLHGWLRLTQTLYIRKSSIKLLSIILDMTMNDKCLVCRRTLQSLPEGVMTPAELLLLQYKRWTFVCRCVWHSGNPSFQSHFLLSQLKLRGWQLFVDQYVLEPTTHETNSICFSFAKPVYRFFVAVGKCICWCEYAAWQL